MFREINLKEVGLKRLETRSIDIEYNNPVDTDKPMTTVIGMKSLDGIIISSDSQGTNDRMKSLETSKIFTINTSMGVGLAGDVGHINTFVDELRAQLESFGYRTELDLRLRLDHIMCDLYRRYNVERSRKLGFERTMSIFDASAILGAKLPDNGFALYRLRFTPWVDPITNYVAIGSGEVYAELLMRQQSRAIPAMNIPDSISYQIWTIMLAINEIKSIEPKTGGATQVMIIGKDGVRLLDRDEVIRLYAEYRQIVGRQLAPILHIAEADAMALFPDP